MVHETPGGVEFGWVNERDVTAVPHVAPAAAAAAPYAASLASRRGMTVTNAPTGLPFAIVQVSPNDPRLLPGTLPGLNLRDAPKTGSRGSRILSTLPNGTRLLVLSPTMPDADGFQWRQVRTTDGREGFVAFADPSGTANVVPAPGSGAWP
jgi:hypothetical protein